MVNDDGLCEAPRCRNYSTLIWYERGVCRRCFERHCDVDADHKHSLFTMFEVPVVRLNDEEED